MTLELQVQSLKIKIKDKDDEIESLKEELSSKITHLSEATATHQQGNEAAKVEVQRKDSEILTLKQKVKNLTLELENNIANDVAESNRLKELEQEMDALQDEKHNLERENRNFKKDQGKSQHTVDQKERQLTKTREEIKSLHAKIAELETEIQFVTEKDAEEIKQKEIQLKELQSSLKKKETEIQKLIERHTSEKRNLSKLLVKVHKDINEAISVNRNLDEHGGDLEEHMMSLFDSIVDLQNSHQQKIRKIENLEIRLLILQQSSHKKYSSQKYAAEEEIKQTKKEYAYVCKKLDAINLTFHEIMSNVDVHMKGKQKACSHAVDVDFISMLQAKLAEAQTHCLSTPDNSPRQTTSPRMTEYQWTSPLASQSVQKSRPRTTYPGRNRHFSGSPSSSRRYSLPSIAHETLPHIKALNAKAVLLQDNLDCSPLLAYLQQGFHFTQNDCDQTSKGQTDLEKNRTFLRILKKKGPDAYECFLRALKDNSEWLYREMKK